MFACSKITALTNEALNRNIMGRRRPVHPRMKGSPYSGFEVTKKEHVFDVFLRPSTKLTRNIAIIHIYIPYLQAHFCRNSLTKNLSHYCLYSPEGVTFPYHLERLLLIFLHNISRTRAGLHKTFINFFCAKPAITCRCPPPNVLLVLKQMVPV